MLDPLRRLGLGILWLVMLVRALANSQPPCCWLCWWHLHRKDCVFGFVDLWPKRLEVLACGYSVMQAASNPAIGEIFNEWRADDLLCGRASRGFMANIGKRKKLNRLEVAHNAHVLAPVLRHLGALIGYYYPSLSFSLCLSCLGSWFKTRHANMLIHDLFQQIGPTWANKQSWIGIEDISQYWGCPACKVFGLPWRTSWRLLRCSFTTAGAVESPFLLVGYPVDLISIPLKLMNITGFDKG